MIEDGFVLLYPDSIGEASSGQMQVQPHRQRLERQPHLQETLDVATVVRVGFKQSECIEEGLARWLVVGHCWEPTLCDMRIVFVRKMPRLARLRCGDSSPGLAFQRRW